MAERVAQAGPLKSCRAALIRALRASAEVPLDAKGYVGTPAENLIEGVHLEDFEADLRNGDGNEFGGKFRAAYSSSALAVNTFAPFKSRLIDLRLPCGSNFTDLTFERKCPHGLVGRRAPNLDVLMTSPEGVVAIESKCLEPLTPHHAAFAPAYTRELVEQRPSTWLAEMERLIAEPRTYRYLDAAQLVKHGFGLAYTFHGLPVVLVYLYWEPTDAEDHAAFLQHRLEVVRFARSVSGTGPKFVGMSYPQLWRFWADAPQAEWLTGHLRRLRARYEVALN